jgi:hypothetical protein
MDIVEYSFNNISIKDEDCHDTYFYLRRILEAIIDDPELLEYKRSYNDLLQNFIKDMLRDRYNDYLYDEKKEDTNENYEEFLNNFAKEEEEDAYGGNGSYDVYILCMNTIRKILKLIR